MVTLPAEGNWSLRALSDDDGGPALAFLRRDPLINVYLISRLMEERFASSAQMVEVRYCGDIVLVASLATNIVMGADPELPDEITHAAIAAVAERILTRMLPVRAIISPAPLVEVLWRRLGARLDPPTVVRLNQPVYSNRGRLDFPDLTTARYSTLRDLDELVPACAAMHQEEVGIDPMERDAVGYRDRVRDLITKSRSIILVAERTIVAKSEFSAITPDCVQLMGVWTHPRFRRRGYGRELLREVCGHLARKGKTVTLFVNDFNQPAIQLYESLGFARIGVNRALIW